MIGRANSEEERRLLLDPEAKLFHATVIADSHLWAVTSLSRAFANVAVFCCLSAKEQATLYLGHKTRNARSLLTYKQK